jgi:hypothetical protein
MCLNASEIAAGFLKHDVYQNPRKNKKRGGVVNREDHRLREQRGFTTQDILWALGIWSVILTLSPVVAFYLRMVN